MWVPVTVWQPCELLYTCYVLTYLLKWTTICLRLVSLEYRHLLTGLPGQPSFKRRDQLSRAVDAGWVTFSDFLEFATNGTKVCRYSWHSARSLGWPFPVLKYKYFFSNKIYGNNLSNSTRKLLWFEITKMMTAVKKINLFCYFIIIFGTLSFPITRPLESSFAVWVASGV